MPLHSPTSVLCVNVLTEDAALMGLGVVGIRESEKEKERRFADVLSDFDLRPSWALAVALKDAVRDEMKRAWHSDEAADDGSLLPVAEADCDLKQTAATSNKEDVTERCQRKFVPGQQEAVGVLKQLLTSFKLRLRSNISVLYRATLNPQDSPADCLLTGDASVCFDALRKRSDLIVIASLVNKAPNLGGLARTSEVFNVR